MASKNLLFLVGLNFTFEEIFILNAQFFKVQLYYLRVNNKYIKSIFQESKNPSILSY